MQVQRINPTHKRNQGQRVKSQRLINVMLQAKRENPSISIQELNYVAFGFRERDRS